MESRSTPRRVHVDGNLAGGLHGVAMKANVRFRGDAADFFDGLDGAEFVVGVHHADQHGFRAAARGECLRDRRRRRGPTGTKVTSTPCVPSSWQAFRTAWCSMAVVMMCLRGRRRDAADDAEDGEIVGFGAAAGEDDFAGLGAEQRGDGFARVSTAAGRAGPRNESSWRCRSLGEIRQHGVEDGGVHGGGGVVIEIGAHDEKLRVFRIAVRDGGVKQRLRGRCANSMNSEHAGARTQSSGVSAKFCTFADKDSG